MHNNSTIDATGYERLDNFEKRVHERLAAMLVSRKVIDEMLPDAEDIESRWERIVTAYLPDGVREFAAYPTVSLGWMMFTGMAVARMWDLDWEVYSQIDDLYGDVLLKGRGYDEMDEYICQDVLGLDYSEAVRVSALVGDMSAAVHGMLMHEGFEAGTPEAFQAYVRCLHQLYYFGAAVELRMLGYHMTKL